LVLVVVGLVVACGSAQGSQGAGDCVEAITVDGVLYARDSYNDTRLRDEHLGETVGTIDGTYDCGDVQGEGGQAGISGSPGLQGERVWTVGGQPAASMLAVETDWGIRLYRSVEVSPLESVFEGDVSAIGINSEFDGETRFATIEDPATVERLVSGLADAEPVARTGGGGVRYFIEFEHQGVLVTVVPFFVDDNQLGDRVVGDEWSAAIDRALSASPNGPTVDWITLEGASGIGTFRPLGACRTDRIDLDVTPGELLTASSRESAEEMRWLNPAEPLQTSSTGSSQIGSTVVVPNFEGSAILEVRLADRDGERALEGCLTLGSDRSSPSSGPNSEPVPTGTIDCRDSTGDGEPTGAEYPAADAMTFDTPSGAVEHWQNDPARVDTFGPTRLTAVLSDFTSVVDLVSGSGSVEGSLMLSNNGNGWFVRTESLCPPADGSG